MNYIVLDLEFNGRRHYDVYPMEIIEIGAVKLNDDLTIADTFQSYIRPRFPINHFALEFCGIRKEVLCQSPSFKEVIQQFISFCGAEYKLIAWGGSDFFNLFVDCKVNRIDNGWLVNLLDAARFFDGGLQKAVQDHGLEAIGQHHSALDDALNAAQLLQLKPEIVKDEHYFAPNEFKLCTGGIKKWISMSLDHAASNGEVLTWDQFIQLDKTQLYFSIMNLTADQIKMVETAFMKFYKMKYGRKWKKLQLA